jgi:DNA mismatch endonuclease, patch repair protein
MGGFQRDGRAPLPRTRATSNVMRANKGKDTGPEMALRKALRDHGLGGYRLHWHNAPGRPDICYPGRALAIFVNGCFWHRCPRCNLDLPRTHPEFWSSKFSRNVERDSRKVIELQEVGWKVLVVWECEISEDVEAVVEKIRKVLDPSRSFNA